MQLSLADKVRAKIELLGQERASKYFGISIGTVSLWARGGKPSLEAGQLILNEYYSNVEILNQVVDGQMPKSELWEGRNVIILLPVYRNISYATQKTLFHNYSKYGAEKIGLIMYPRTLIVEARNILAMKFLRTTAEWAIFIDDDIVLPCGSADVFNNEFGAALPKPYSEYLFIDRIMENNLPLVGALYFGRHAAGKAQYSGGFESAVENANAHKLVNPGIKPCSWVATGAMKIHRSVFEKIMTAAPEHFPDIIPTQEGRPWGFFRQFGNGIGEDVSFCYRAAKVGVQPHVDTSLICLHEGTCYYGPSNTHGEAIQY